MTFPQQQSPDLSSIEKIARHHKKSFKKIQKPRLEGIVGNTQVMKIIELAQKEKAGTITIHLKDEDLVKDEEDSQSENRALISKIIHFDALSNSDVSMEED